MKISDLKAIIDKANETSPDAEVKVAFVNGNGNIAYIIPDSVHWDDRKRFPTVPNTLVFVTD